MKKLYLQHGFVPKLTLKNHLRGEKIFTSKTQITIVLILFVSFGLWYSFYIPLWNPPDEERHFAYLEYIAQNNKLPHLKLDQEHTHIAQAIHPPLYYLIGSLFCRDEGKVLPEELTVNDGPGFNTIVHPKHESEFPYSGKARTAHLLRYFSVALSSVTIYFIYLIVLIIFPGETLLASAAALFAGMNPQFLHISASVTNENLSSALSTIYLFVLLCYLKYPLKPIHYIVTGVLLGCCLLSKTSTLFYLPLTLCLLAWVNIRHKRKLIESLLLIFGTATLVAGWWYARNWLVFDDPLLKKFLAASQPWGLRTASFSLSYLATIISQSFISFFGNFGALQIVIPGTHLIVYGGITGFGIAGLCRMLVKRELTPFQAQALVVLFLSLLGGLGIFLSLNMSYRGVSMGRYLFVVIAPIAALTFTGVYFLIPHRLRNPAMVMISLLMILISMDVVFRILRPAYAEPSLEVGIDQPLFCCPTVEIEEATTIAQSFISTQNNLSAIRVMFSSLNKTKSGELTFSLKESSDKEKVLRRIIFPLKNIEDNARYFFIFPPIKHSVNKTYLFSFRSPSQPAGKGIALWYEASDCYSGGSMFINGKPVSGDLCYTTYCFNGEHPETEWEGTKETVISQGLYVGVRELQLYYERSKAHRGKMITHEKIMRMGKALNNRTSAIKQK